MDREEDVQTPLRQLGELCIEKGCTLLLGWSFLEVARYLETLKLYEGKPATLIQEKKGETFEEKVRDVLTTIRSVNKTDVARLSSNFRSLKSLMSAEIDDLALTPGLGSTKANRIFSCWHQPFKKAKKK